jgi:hypothetical protein
MENNTSTLTVILPEKNDKKGTITCDLGNTLDDISHKFQKYFNFGKDKKIEFYSTRDSKTAPLASDVPISETAASGSVIYGYIREIPKNLSTTSDVSLKLSSYYNPEDFLLLQLDKSFTIQNIKDRFKVSKEAEEFGEADFFREHGNERLSESLRLLDLVDFVTPTLHLRVKLPYKGGGLNHKQGLKSLQSLVAFLPENRKKPIEETVNLIWEYLDGHFCDLCNHPFAAGEAYIRCKTCRDENQHWYELCMKTECQENGRQGHRSDKGHGAYSDETIREGFRCCIF